MKITKLQNNVGIGTKIKVLHRTGRDTVQTILSTTGSSRWCTDMGYYISKNFTIEGINGIIATWKPISFKRFKFRYKR